MTLLVLYLHDFLVYFECKRFLICGIQSIGSLGGQLCNFIIIFL